MVRYDRISVVFPIFGDFDFRSLFLAVESVRAQNYPNVEIIVSEENDSPKYRKMAREQGIVYVCRKPRKKDLGSNLGRVKNFGIRKATGKYVYLNDSDIVFMNRNYLSLLIRRMKKVGTGFMTQPAMKRLVVGDFEKFYGDACRDGIIEGISVLRFRDGYTTSVDKKNTVRVVPYGWRNRKMTVFRNEWKKISKKDLEMGYGYGLMSFSFHPGAIFVEKERLLRVGGYCENFKGWGFDDVDLQIKLGSTLKKRLGVAIPKRKSYEVLHLDHKGNFDRERYEVNREVFEKRREISLRKLFASDKEAGGFA